MLFRCLFEAFDALGELLFLLGKLWFVLVPDGLLQCGNDNCFDGSVTNAFFRLFVDSVFQDRGTFKVEIIDLCRVLLGDFDLFLFQLSNPKQNEKQIRIEFRSGQMSEQSNKGNHNFLYHLEGFLSNTHKIGILGATSNGFEFVSHQAEKTILLFFEKGKFLHSTS